MLIITSSPMKVWIMTLHACTCTLAKDQRMPQHTAILLVPKQFLVVGGQWWQEPALVYEGTTCCLWLTMWACGSLTPTGGPSQLSGQRTDQ